MEAASTGGQPRETLRTAVGDTGWTTRLLIEQARSTTWGSMPADVVVHARHCLLDWVGTAVAGSREDVSRLVWEQLAEYGGGRAATVIGRGTSNVRDAAMHNGVAGHALDFDDVLLDASSHVSAVVMPAALAVAERNGLHGDALLTAFVAGFELMADLGAAVGERHYAQGFHATATLGPFGAAAAVARLRDFDPRQWQNALGLAATSAAGLKSMFGTMAKPLHAGWAAQSGVVAADLAARGLTAAHDVIERPQGFAAAHGDQVDGSQVGTSWRLRNNLFKFHPSCFLTHAAIDAARSLRDRHDFCFDEIEHVMINVHPGHLDVCNIERPTTGAEAKFSLRYAVASALTQDVNLWSAFTNEAVGSGAVNRLVDRVDVAPRTNLPRKRSEVHVTFRDDRRLEAAIDATRELTEPDLVAREIRLSRKFDALTSPLLGSRRAEELRTAILATDETMLVADLTRVLREGAVPLTSDGSI